MDSSDESFLTYVAETWGTEGTIEDSPACKGRLLALAQRAVHARWRPIATVENTVFDVVCKTWDAHTDRFLLRRFANCVLVKGVVVACVVDVGGNDGHLTLVDNGHLPLWWTPAPEAESWMDPNTRPPEPSA